MTKYHQLQDGTIAAIFKPIGLTSHDVIDKLRALTGIKRIGHAGTLDPLAEGVLVVGIGRQATKKLGDFSKMDKEYQAKITFGQSTTTYDVEGVIVESSDCWQTLTREQVEVALKKFIGMLYQVPPVYSAKKIAGQKAYELARMGRKLNLKPNKVNIYRIDIIDWQPPTLTLKIVCSSGTYIRSIAHDLGQKLNCPAHLSGLVRTRVDHFRLADCIQLD